MANEFEILLKSTADGTGAQQTAADLDKVEASAQAAAAATRELTEAEREQIGSNVAGQPQRGLDPIQLDAAQRMAQYEAEAQEAEITRNEEIKRQKGEILLLEEERLQAAAAGNTAEAEAIADQIAARKLALTIQTQTGEEEAASIERAEAMVALKADAAEQARLNEQADAVDAELAQQRLASETAITAERAAQNAESEAGSLRGLGTAGRASGEIAQGLGLGSLAGPLGFAVFGFMEGKRWIDQWISGIAKANEEAGKFGDSVEKSNVALEAKVNHITSSNQAEQTGVDIQEKLIDTQEKVDAAQQNILRDKGAQREADQQIIDLGTAQISNLQRMGDQLDINEQKMQDEADDEKQAAEAEQARIKAVDEYGRQRVQFQDKLDEANLKNLSPEGQLDELQKRRTKLLGNQPGAQAETPEDLYKESFKFESSDPEHAKGLIDTAQKLLEINDRIATTKKKIADDDAREQKAEQEEQQRQARKALQLDKHDDEHPDGPTLIGNANAAMARVGHDLSLPNNTQAAQDDVDDLKAIIKQMIEFLATLKDAASKRYVDTEIKTLQSSLTQVIATNRLH